MIPNTCMTISLKNAIFHIITRRPGQIPEGKLAITTGLSDHPPAGWFYINILRV